MLLLNKFRYFTNSRFDSLAQDFITVVDKTSIFGLEGISGGKLFSIASLLDLVSVSGYLKLFSINSETRQHFKYFSRTFLSQPMSH